jgi:hypothetical protein
MQNPMLREPPPPAPTPAPRSPPLRYSGENAARVCNAIIEGTPLGLVHELDGMPARTMIDLWHDVHPDFRSMCRRANAFYADRISEEIVAIADGTDGNPTRAVTGREEHPSRARLRIDVRRWLAGKLAPQTYGVRAVSGEIPPSKLPVQVKPDGVLETDRKRAAAAEAGAQ